MMVHRPLVCLNIPLINTGGNNGLPIDIDHGDRLFPVSKRLSYPNPEIVPLILSTDAQNVSSQINDRTCNAILCQILPDLIGDISFRNSAKIQFHTGFLKDQHMLF